MMITTLTLSMGVLWAVLVWLSAWSTSWSTIIGNIEKKWISYCSFLLHFFFVFSLFTVPYTFMWTFELCTGKMNPLIFTFRVTNSWAMCFLKKRLQYFDLIQKIIIKFNNNREAKIRCPNYKVTSSGIMNR